MKTLVITSLALLSLSAVAAPLTYECSVGVGTITTDEYIVDAQKVIADGRNYKFGKNSSKKGKGVQIKIEHETTGYYQGYLCAKVYTTSDVSKESLLMKPNTSLIGLWAKPGATLMGSVYDSRFTPGLRYFVNCELVK
ncbi:MAG: hypothetical protein H0V66_10535 [Bdellovibrionales bacterium]|nr:hypothetical protein [Bdellovibrionales bacterium]